MVYGAADEVYRTIIVVNAAPILVCIVMGHMTALQTQRAKVGVVDSATILSRVSRYSAISYRSRVLVVNSAAYISRVPDMVLSVIVAVPM